MGEYQVPESWDVNSYLEGLLWEAQGHASKMFPFLETNVVGEKVLALGFIPG